MSHRYEVVGAYAGQAGVRVNVWCRKHWLLWLLLALLPCIGAQAQGMDGVPLYGRLMNADGVSVPGAVVLLVQPQDSSIVCHAVTDTVGRFVMHCQASGTYWLQSHVMGYLPESQHVQVPRSEPLEVRLREDPKEIEAVRIQARRQGVRVLGDTVKYNLKAFTTGAEKTLGELLSSLPGIKVAEDGTVTAQGQQVEKILFNGRDLYGSNVALATKNVSADMADSVKVVHGYSEYSLLDGFQNHDKTVIDVGVNESMWGKLSGEIEAGGGYRSAYEGRGNAMYMGKTSMLSAVIAANNTGGKTFTYNDYIALQGGLPKDENGLYRIEIRSDDYLYRLINPPKDTYAQRTEMVTLNYTYSRGERLKVQTAALYSGGLNKTEQWTTRRFANGPDIWQPRYTSSESHTRMNGGAGVLNVTYHPSERFLWQYGTMVKYSRVRMGYSEQEYYRGAIHWYRSNGWQRPVELQQRFLGTMKLGRFQLQASLGHELSTSRSDMYQTMDRALYPFRMTPNSDGSYSLMRPKTTRSNTLTAGLTGKAKLTEKQFLQLSVGGEFNAWEMESQWLNHGVVPQLLPGLPGTLADFATVHRYGGSAGVKWCKNAGLVQFTVGVVGHWKRWNAGIHGGTQRRYLEPDLMFKLYFSQLHQLWITVEGASESTRNETLFASYDPSGYHELYYSQGLEFPLTKRTDMTANYMWYAPNGVWSLYCTLGCEFGDRIEKEVQMHGPYQLHRLWEVTLRRPLWTYLSLNRTFFTFWNASASLNIRMFDGSVSRVAGKELFHSQEQISAWLSLRSTYKSMFNVTLQGSGTYYDHNYGERWREELYEWQVKGGLVFKHGPVRATVQSGWRVSPFGLIGPSDIILEGDVSYNFWKNMSLVLVGHDVLNIGARNWASIHYSDLYRTETTYRRLSGNVQLKLRWKFGESKGKNGIDVNVL